jgi:hypothetical protein
MITRGKRSGEKCGKNTSNSTLCRLHRPKIVSPSPTKPLKPLIPQKLVEYSPPQKPVVPTTKPTVKPLDDAQREQVIRGTLVQYNIFVKDQEGIKELIALKRWKNLNPETYRKYYNF